MKVSGREKEEKKEKLKEGEIYNEKIKREKEKLNTRT